MGQANSLISLVPRRGWSLFGLLVLVVGCAQKTDRGVSGESSSALPEASTVEGQGRLVELFSWWTAPGEAEAFQRLVDEHKSLHPEVRLFNAAVASGVRAKEVLKQRLVDNEIPDVFQENAHDLNLYIRQNPGKILPLDGLFDELKIRSVIYPEVLADLAVDGHLYSLPVNLHRENTLIYNKRLFAQYGLKVPRNLDELLIVCDAFKKRGVTPLATSHQGWILRILFNSLLIAKMGVLQYQDYITSKVPPNESALRESIRILDELLTNYSNSDAGEDGFGWMNAAQAVYNGDAAMYFHGDWAKGYLVQLGAVSDVDIGTVAAPGTQGMFLYSIDVFAIPRHAPNEVGAKAFLATIVSPSAQAEFNRIKGASPVRLDVPADQFDQSGQETIRELVNAKVRMMVRIGDGWDLALGEFAKEHDEEALYETYVTNRPVD